MADTLKRIGNYRWTICALIFFATTVNYLDRQVIGILKPTLEQNLGIDEKPYSHIVMAFQFFYAFGMLLTGRLIDKWGTKIGYSIAVVVWSLAAMGHALAKGALGFGFWRSLLGLGESANFPAANKGVAEWFPKKERALAFSIINSGTNVGAIVAPLAVPAILALWGWQAAFIITGAIGFIWLIFWYIIYETPPRKANLSKEEYDYIHSDEEEQRESHNNVSWFRLLRYRQTWLFFIGKALTDPIWWFYLFWIPGWLSDVRGAGLNVKSFGLPLAFIYTSTTVGSIFGGWLSSYMIKKGMSPFRARSIAMLVFAVLVTPIAFASSPSISTWGAVCLIALAASSHQAWSANIFTTVSDAFPKNVVSSVTSIGGMAGALSGLGISYFTGFILDFYKKAGHVETGYVIIFTIAACAYIIAWLIMNIFAPVNKKVEL